MQGEHDLGLGVAEAAVELHHLGPLLRDHEPGVEEPPERGSPRRPGPGAWARGPARAPPPAARGWRWTRARRRPCPPCWGPCPPRPPACGPGREGGAPRLSPSATAKTESSSPSMKSSTTTSRPASPKAQVPEHGVGRRPRRPPRWRTPPRPCPRPAPRPSPRWGRRAPAGTPARPRGRVNVRYSAVGTPAPRMRSLAKALLDSMRAASRVGPKTGSPCFRNRSTTPCARGASGPTTVRSMRCAAAHPERASTSVGAMATGEQSGAMPPLGRVAKKLGRRGVPPELPEEGVLTPAVADDEDAHGGEDRT